MSAERRAARYARCAEYHEIASPYQVEGSVSRVSAEVREVPPALVTVPEACARLRIGDSTLYRWIEQGQLPRDAVVRIGNGRRRGVRIKTWWLESYLQSGQMPKVREIGRRRT